MCIYIKTKDKYMFERILCKESETGPLKSKYEMWVLEEPVTADFIKITKKNKRMAIADISKAEGYNDDTYDASRRKFERNFNRILEDFGLKEYKELFKVFEKNKTKYYFSEDDMPFLTFLMNENYIKLTGKGKMQKEDLFSLGIRLYNCFCNIEDIKDEQLKDISGKISKKIGIDNLEYIMPLECKFNNIKEFAYDKILSDNIIEKNGSSIYETLQEDLADLDKKWRKMFSEL